MLDLSNGAVSASAGALLLLIDGDGVDGGVVSNGDDGESGEGIHCLWVLDEGSGEEKRLLG